MPIRNPFKKSQKPPVPALVSDVRDLLSALDQTLTPQTENTGPKLATDKHEDVPTDPNHPELAYVQQAARAQQLQSLSLEHIQQELKVWDLRFKVYGPLSGPHSTPEEQAMAKDFNHRYKKFHKGHYSKHTRKRLAKIKQYLLALQEQPSGIAYDEVKEIFLIGAKLELLKLRISQLKKLEKIQHVNHAAISGEIIELQKQKQALNDYVAIRKNSLKFKRDKNKVHSFKLLKKLNKPIDIGKHKGKIEKAASIARTANYVRAFVMTIAMPLIHFAVPIVSALPLVPQIVAGFKIFYDFVSPMIRGSGGQPNKPMMVGLIAIPILGTVLAAAGIVATMTALAITSATLTLMGAVKSQLLPWIKLRREINRTEKALKNCDKEVYLHNRFPLSKLHKKILLRKLDQLMEHALLSPQLLQQLQEAKRLIIMGTNKEALFANPLIRQLTKGDNEKVFNLFMRDTVIAHKETLKNDLKQFKKEELLARVNLLGGVFAIVGAILFCIPTPPTMAIGAALLASSSLVTVALKYKWIDKAINYFTKPTVLTESAKQLAKIEEMEKQIVASALKELISPKAWQQLDTNKTYQVNLHLLAQLKDAINLTKTIAVWGNAEERAKHVADVMKILDKIAILSPSAKVKSFQADGTPVYATAQQTPGQAKVMGSHHHITQSLQHAVTPGEPRSTPLSRRPPPGGVKIMLTEETKLQRPLPTPPNPNGRTPPAEPSKGGAMAKSAPQTSPPLMTPSRKSKP